ncbi:WPP domain-interacting tail-anchored protein 2-like isoform X1 [Prosopis cineraria]|uniref:WPP domain-interacting tail-anchored protein 2-like isoform X1 n=2 Tax=Prosopis cineraria TaxID=364024 RepID=UPI00240FF979|nr:WPP domain-interacting tail-anchored protein 2-like isoform X1 [Prosopis cineraria]
MDDYTDEAKGGSYFAEAAFEKLYSLEGFSTKEHDTQELDVFLQALAEVDFCLAYSSEKLMNLHKLLIHLLSQENDLEAVDLKNNCISIDFIEKAFAFDILLGILDSEVRELDNFMDTLQAEIVDARHKMLSCRDLKFPFTMEEKLHDSEESVKDFQQQLLELKMQSSILRKTLEAFQHENWETGKGMNLSENGQLTNTKVESNDQIVEQRRYILRMLEKSLAREVDLEKKVAESREHEDLKLKLHYTEQLSMRMEEAAEFVWGRFLEAETAAEMLMGISKDLMGRLQIAELNLNGSTQRENELKLKVQTCIEGLKDKDSSLEKLERINAELMKENSEVQVLREKVKNLEEERKEFELHLSAVTSENETNQEHLIEMENHIESLKESIYTAETRAESAEAKATQLTETNLELTEELHFLKGIASNAEKKVGSLEKQIRESEIQLQNAKASSEASQEQQKKLYSAIWDMELLIEELKSKVSKPESKTESAEEPCIVLSETNEELIKELDLLRSRIKSLETSLDQANKSKISSAKEINVRTKFIMDMVMQLTIEREHVHKQLCTLKIENRSLAEKLKNMKKDVPLDSCHVGLNNSNDDQASNVDSSNGSCTKSSDEEGKDILNQNFQVDEPSEDASSETKVESSIPSEKSGKFGTLAFFSMAIIVLLASFLATFLFDKETLQFLRTFDG